MVSRKKTLYFASFCLGALFLTGFSDISPEPPNTGFWAMKGTLVIHSFEQKNDSFSGPELYELQDENGLPIWFSRHIYKDVCMSGLCKKIRIWLFWDGAGNYMGLQNAENEPLTKHDHTEFEPEDYQKLDEILRNPASILKSTRQEELIVVPNNPSPYEVDGYTAATQPALAELVVKDAVYTCYTLWHTVYGPVQTKISEIIETRLDKEYLKEMFLSPKPEYKMWAIGFVENHPAFHHDFQQHIIELVISENEILAMDALAYFRSEYLNDVMIQMKLADALMHSTRGVKNNILWMFIDFKEIDAQVILKLLKLFDDEVLGIGDYNLILKLVSTEKLESNHALAERLRDLSSHENAYIRGLTQRMLNEKLKVKL